MGFFFTKIVRNLIFLALILQGVNYYLRWKSYDISVKDFKAISIKSADQNSLNAISRFSSEMRRRYPSKIATEAVWVPLSAGGLQLKAQFLYGGLTEYVGIFTAVGDTSGRSGLHWSNSSCTVLSGEVSRASDAFSSPVKETFTQGQNFRHGQFDSYVYFLKDGTTVACYGRGFVPASSIWTVSGGLAAGDPLSIAKMTYAYGRLTFDQLAHALKEVTDGATNYVKNKAPKMEF